MKGEALFWRGWATPTVSSRFLERDILATGRADRKGVPVRLQVVIDSGYAKYRT